MLWRFNDGTVGHLGGRIEGDSTFAIELRATLADEPIVALHPCPCEAIPLDPDNAAHFDHWLTAQVHRPRWRDHGGLKLVERPKGIPEIPPRPGDGRKLGPNEVY